MRSPRRALALLCWASLALGAAEAAPATPGDRRETFYLSAQAQKPELGSLAGLLPDLPTATDASASDRVGPSDSAPPWVGDGDGMRHHSRRVLPYLERALETARGNTYSEGVRILTERAEQVLEQYQDSPVWVLALMRGALRVSPELSRDEERWSVLHTVFRGVVEFQGGVFGPPAESRNHGLRIARLAAYQKPYAQAGHTLRTLVRGFLGEEETLFRDASLSVSLAALYEAISMHASDALTFRGLEGGLRRLERGGTGRALFVETCAGMLGAWEHLEGTDRERLLESMERYLDKTDVAPYKRLAGYGSRRSEDEIPRFFEGWFAREVLGTVRHMKWSSPRVVRTALAILGEDHTSLRDYFDLCLRLIFSQRDLYFAAAFAHASSDPWPRFQLTDRQRAVFGEITHTCKKAFMWKHRSPPDLRASVEVYMSGLKLLMDEADEPPGA